MNVDLSPGEWAGVMTCVKEQARALRRDAETDPSVAAADGRERADDLDRIAGVIRTAIAGDEAPEPSLPELPVGADRCPHVMDDGSVCGSAMTWWERVDSGHGFRWHDGTLIVSDGRIGDGEFDALTCDAHLHEWSPPVEVDWE